MSAVIEKLSLLELWSYVSYLTSLNFLLLGAVSEKM